MAMPLKCENCGCTMVTHYLSNIIIIVLTNTCKS